MENIKSPVSKEAVDTALESLKGHPGICWSCIEQHYPKEFSKRNCLYAYRMHCHACAVKTECTWSSVWRILIYPSKSVSWLINRFEKDLDYYIDTPSLAADEQACSALKHKCKEVMIEILDHLEKQTLTQEVKSGWAHLFFWYALRYKVVPHDPFMPKNYDEWVPVLKQFIC